jgi:hypothetical protein
MHPTASMLYVMDAANTLDGHVRVNGATLALGAGDMLPSIPGAPTPAGPVAFAPATITFAVIPAAENNACR